MYSELSTNCIFPCLALVAPSMFTTDIDKYEEMEGTMYIDAPVSVPIRATAEAGEITFTVNSPGLKSASIQIVSVTPESDGVSGIQEPELNGNDAPIVYNRGNRTVKKEFVPDKGIKFNVDDIDFGQLESTQYAELISEYIKERNANVEAGSYAYSLLINEFVEQLNKGKGIIVADDYNFIVQRYNDFCRISQI